MSRTDQTNSKPTPQSSEANFPAGVALRPLDETQLLDWRVIGSYLQQQGLHVDARLVPRQFAGGLANFNYLLRVNGEWAVLRRPPSGPLPPGANDMRREHRILSRLSQGFTLAPRSFHLCQDPSIAGAPFQLIEFRAGVAIRGDQLAPFPETAETGLRLSLMMVETLAALHAVDVNAVGLGDLGRPDGFFRRTTEGWIKRCELISEGAPSGAARESIRWLNQVADPTPSAPVLLHNDFKLDNLLLDRHTQEPVAIVDWDMGTRGDALFDLATLLSYWSEAGDPSGMQRLGQMPSARPGFISREQVARGYSHATGRSINELKPYRVLTQFKLAVVFQQLYQRYRSGETGDPRYADFGRLADELHEFTLAITTDKTF
ncbi:phosphotransferase family protein [Pseudomonas jessenii]|uniref:phosphotransferase family protein n=1 Tax=Pseudomonas jessenii TaxID=77298 RepID=UPI003891555C